MRVPQERCPWRLGCRADAKCDGGGRVCTCSNPKEFEADMNQIFTNCKTYNPPHDPVYKAVRKPIGRSPRA